jgi:hypothetical protein
MNIAPLRAALFAPLSLLFAALAPAQEHLELGKMWTFENPPLGYLKKTYDFEPSQEWLDALRMASLRYGNGCSASFVSPHGLIMTNHHCARGDIARISPPDADWVTTGYFAATPEDEVRIEGLTVQQLVSMEDVTARVGNGIRDSDSETVRARKQEANRKEIEEAARRAHPRLTPQVVELHQGAVHQLYLYKTWDDVRLVFAPHLQTAHFGGDPDNFTYPRYSIDFAFCRAWENGRPADTSAHYFRWKEGGAKEGDLVFVTGNPGSTGRLLTLAQMHYLRDAQYPIVRELLDHRLAITRALIAENPTFEQSVRTTLLSYENAQKAYAGYHSGLLDERLMARKAQAEAEFKAKVAADAELATRFGSVWDDLAIVAGQQTLLEPMRRFHTHKQVPPLERAALVVRAVQTGADASLAEKALAEKGEWTPLERALFVDQLQRMQRWLAPSDPWVRATLGGERTALDTARALERSRIHETAFVRALLEGGAPAVASSDDPAIALARVLVPLIDRNKSLEESLTQREDALGAAIGQALFACYGNKISPDATFTLRFSDGVVRGFPYNGTLAPHRTSFYGLYARHAEFDGKHPFDLPAVWLERQPKIDLTRAVDFVSTNDIIGGNSGSPMVNRDLEIVGLIFDGNIEMLPNRFFYTDEVARCVSVHVDAIMESLRVVYDAARIADELLGRE